MKRLWVLIVVLIIAGCSGGNEGNTNKESNEEEKESVIFRQIDVIADGDQIKIAGEVKSWDGNFYYHVIQGEDIIINEQEFSSEHIGFWTPFKIEIDKELIVQSEEDVPHIVLFGKNKAEEQINPNYVPMDLGEE